MSKMSDNIQDIVDNLLCTQCGTCVSVCTKDAIEMRETPSGLLMPFVNEGKCNACGSCRKLCPGEAIEVDLPMVIDPFRGEVYGAYVGHAGDEVVRSTGQSGGVVSGLLLFLLTKERIDAALVTSMPTDGSLRPESRLVRTPQEILNAQGSIYCPVASNAVLGDINAGDRIAIVGVSCQMQGIHRLARHRHKMVNGIQYRIGLF